ncbi:MAG: glycosyltransferase family 4 protein [Chloroflexi bacterium]|nr:glycosyltransferase family 4 protein [Chloroflexota bacterium]
MINFLPRFLDSPSPNRRGGWGVRCAVTFHDLLPAYLFPKAGPLRDWVTFQLARGADAVIATNSADYARLRENVRGLKKWLKLIPIGSNIAPTTPPPDFNRIKLRDRLGVRDDETLLVYFGFLNASKGAETLIRALYDLPKTKLLFLGGQTGESDPTNVAYLEQVKQAIRDWGLEHRVLWTDYMPAEQVSAHFYASDVCVLPYRDGASFRRGSFMAALAHGIPIVTTQPANMKAEGGRRKDETNVDDGDSSFILHLSSLPVLQDGDNVLLVPPDDPDAIILAVTRVQTSPGLAALLSGNARITARAFTWDKIADEHLDSAIVR